MFSIKPLAEFIHWIDGLTDAAVRGVVVARIKRLERGLMGDVEPEADIKRAKALAALLD